MGAKESWEFVRSHPLTCVLAVAIAVQIALCLMPSNKVKRAIDDRLITMNSEHLKPFTWQVDELFAGVEGNIFVHFEGWDLDSARDCNAAINIYYRSQYTLHPKMVHVTKEATTISAGKKLLQINEIPDSAWLREQGITQIYRLRKHDGELKPVVEDLR